MDDLNFGATDGKLIMFIEVKWNAEKKKRPVDKELNSIQDQNADQIRALVDRYMIRQNKQHDNVQKQDIGADRGDAVSEEDSAMGLFFKRMTRYADALEKAFETAEQMPCGIHTDPEITKSGKKRSEEQAEERKLMRRPALPEVKKYGMMTDKVSKTLVSASGSPKQTNGQTSYWWGVNQSSKKDTAHQIPVYVALRYNEAEGNISGKMSEFDLAVYDAVSTLFYYHHSARPNEPGLYITPEDVWRTMNGIHDSRKTPTPNQKRNVCLSLDKMRFTRFFMDISQEINARHITFKDSRVVKGKIETYLLKADKVSFCTEKGNEVTGYKIDAEPILYSYCKAKGHVKLVNFNLLDTSDKTGNEGYTVEFRSYLLQQIQLMYEHKRNSTRILYSTLYSETAIPEPADRISKENYTSDNAYRTAVKKEAKKDHDKINAILESWKAKNWIVDYSPVKNGRAFSGVDILLNNDFYISAGTE